MRLAIAVALALLFAAPAQAQDVTGSNTTALQTAAAYWGAGPACPNGVHVTVDQALVGDDNFATGGGCGIWVGDRFAAETPGSQCQTITHEWGHLLGYGEDHAWRPGLPADPVGVMTSFTLPPACAALDDQPQSASVPVARIVRGACPFTDALECTDRTTGTIYLSPYADRFALEHARGHLFDAQRLDDGEREKLKRLLALPGRPWRSDTGPTGALASPSERFADAYAACRLHLDPVSRWMSSYDYQPSRSGFKRTCATIARAAD